MPLKETGCLQQGVASFSCPSWAFISVAALQPCPFPCLSEQRTEARREKGRAERRGSNGTHCCRSRQARGASQQQGTLRSSRVSGLMLRPHPSRLAAGKCPSKRQRGKPLEVGAGESQKVPGCREGPSSFLEATGDTLNCSAFIPHQGQTV